MNTEQAKNNAMSLFNLAQDNKDLGGMRFMVKASENLFGETDETTQTMKHEVKNYLPF